MVEQVKAAERLGFDSIWAGEHHLTDGFHFFPQLTLLSHLAAAFAELAVDRFVIGRPEEVTAQLVAQHRNIGMTHLAMRVAWPGSSGSEALECIELLGTKVLPAVHSELRRPLEEEG